jgi:hypothetical protein
MPDMADDWRAVPRFDVIMKGPSNQDIHTTPLQYSSDRDQLSSICHEYYFTSPWVTASRRTVLGY